MAGKKKDKKGKKKTTKVSKYPPPVILKDWPGKLTEQEIQDRHQALLEESKDNYSLVRITQTDWKFHDFYVIIDQKTPILALQYMISQIQHLGAILPQDVLIFKSLNDKSTSNVYSPEDTLQFNQSVDRFSRYNSPWAIRQPIFLNNQYAINNLQYLHINYDVIPYMDIDVQKSLMDDIWDSSVFKNSLVMSFSDHVKKVPSTGLRSQQFNAAFDFRRLSMIKGKK
jgi:hypothetical protein